MYITHSFVGIKKGDLDYLFFYLTEEYIENQRQFTQVLQPMLEELAFKLKDKGAVVQSFQSQIDINNNELSETWSNLFKDAQSNGRLYNDIDRPALLILNSEIKEIKDSNFLLLSLKDFEENGNYNIHEMHKFFETLIDITHSGEDLISQVKEYINNRNLKNAQKIMKVDPAIFGIGINGREAIKFFKRFLNKQKT